MGHLNINLLKVHWLGFMSATRSRMPWLCSQGERNCVAAASLNIFFMLDEELPWFSCMREPSCGDGTLKAAHAVLAFL